MFCLHKIMHPVLDLVFGIRKSKLYFLQIQKIVLVIYFVISFLRHVSLELIYKVRTLP